MRGDVYRINLRGRSGHQQQGRRFAVVVQSDDLALLSTVLVAPTSTRARPAVFRPRVTIGGQATLVMLEQMTALTKDTDLGDFAGRLDPAELDALDRALRHVVGLF